MAAQISKTSGNIYALTDRYPYGPIWFKILGVLGGFRDVAPFWPFHYVVKAFLSFTDLLSLCFILLIADQQRLSLSKSAIFFYLNPISILLTGYHGQFDNLAILPILAGIYFYNRLGPGSVQGKALLWIGATLGMIVKHIVFYELIICLNASIRRFWVKLVLFTVSLGAFFILFLPFLEKGGQGIIHNVFFYSSIARSYGLGLIFENWGSMKNIFILAMCFFPFWIVKKDLLTQALLGVLFFLVFTTGIAIHYFILPVAFGALKPSKWFLLYSAIGTLFILGSPVNVHIPIFSFVRGNYLWAASVFWLMAELRPRGQEI